MQMWKKSAQFNSLTLKFIVIYESMSNLCLLEDFSNEDNTLRNKYLMTNVKVFIRLDRLMDSQFKHCIGGGGIKAIYLFTLLSYVGYTSKKPLYYTV